MQIELFYCIFLSSVLSYFTQRNVNFVILFHLRRNSIFHLYLHNFNLKFIFIFLYKGKGNGITEGVIDVVMQNIVKYYTRKKKKKLSDFLRASCDMI